MLDRFKELVANSSFLTTMIDRPEPVPTWFLDHCEDGVMYLWDGYMSCAIIHDGQHYWDLQDIATIPENYKSVYSKFSSMEEIVHRMELIGQGECE